MSTNLPKSLTSSRTESDQDKNLDRSSQTLAGTIYDSLRADILTGQLEPEYKLRIDSLSKRYGIGQIPIREALNRLTAEGLVVRQEHRGFAVSPVSADDLAELTKTRCWLEGIALSESIAAHTQAWEEGVVLAFHRLSRLPRTANQSTHHANPEWEQLHRDFHRSLLAGCGSKRLLSVCLQLSDESYRYRQIALKKTFQHANGNGHREIMEAAIGNSAAAAVKSLQAHIQFPARIILKNTNALKAGTPKVKLDQARSLDPKPKK